MESVVVKIEEVKSPTFPLLARHMGTGAIVLFTASHTGMVICEGSGRFNQWKLGTYRSDWSNVFCGDWQILLKGSQILITQ